MYSPHSSANKALLLAFSKSGPLLTPCWIWTLSDSDSELLEHGMESRSHHPSPPQHPTCSNRPLASHFNHTGLGRGAALRLGVHHGGACGRHGRISNRVQHCLREASGSQLTRRCELLSRGVSPRYMVRRWLRKILICQRKEAQEFLRGKMTKRGNRHWWAERESESG